MVQNFFSILLSICVSVCVDVDAVVVYCVVGTWESIGRGSHSTTMEFELVIPSCFAGGVGGTGESTALR